MPAILANVKNFLGNSDFPVDKIIGYKTGSVAIGAFATVFTTVSHPFTFAPLHVTTWSLTPDFAISYNTNSNLGGDTDRADLMVETYPANRMDLSVNNNYATAVTVYYRTYFLMPSNISVDVPATTNISTNKYQYNSDFNYTKLYKQDIQNGNGSYTHNLGALTQVEVWQERANGNIQYYNGSDASNIATGPTVQLDANTIYFAVGSGFSPNPVVKFHYRIYVDA